MATMPWRKRGPRSTRGGARATVKVRTFGCASSWRSERSVNRRPTRDIDACSRIHAAPNSRMLDCLDPRRRLERLVEKAVDYRLRAGELAVKRSALAEAIAQLRQGLKLLPALPESGRRNLQELGLQTAMGRALMGARGFSEPATGRAFAGRANCANRSKFGAAIPDHIRPISFLSYQRRVERGARNRRGNA
jgi:hypothetical protein